MPILFFAKNNLSLLYINDIMKNGEKLWKLIQNKEKIMAK